MINSRSGFELYTSIAVFCFLNFFCTPIAAHEDIGVTEETLFDVGIILDLGSWNGKMSNNCISLAKQDFYEVNPYYRTRLVLHTEDSKDVGTAVLKAVDMLKDVKMQMIVGPQTSAQAEIIAELGSKSHVPVVSFSATSPSLSWSPAPYFIRMAQNDSYQLEAIASLIQAFGWKEVVLIYEETDYGNGIISSLVEAFRTINVRVPYRSSIHPSATDGHILKELQKLFAIPTRVFLVHMLSPLGPRFFLQAKEAGLMTEGNAWIITEGFTNILGSLELSVIDSMLGVIGIKPYIPRSERLHRFKVRMNKKNVQGSDTFDDMNIFCLHAYDTIWALAMAVERVARNHSFQKPKGNRNNSNFSLGISERGPQILEEILESSFIGLSGEIRLVDGQLQPPVFQIINVEQMQREVGFWIPRIGISQRPNVRTAKSLRPIIWPGESTTVPNGKKLKVGYPVKETFTEFVKVELNHSNNGTFVTGYCIDVFRAVMEALPKAILYDFAPFQNSSYDDLLYEVFLQKYDVAIGDITITSNRSLYVDFSLPYTTGGVEMVVPIKYDQRSKFVIFLMLISSSVWVTYIAMFVGSILFVRFLEYESISHLSFPQQIKKVAKDLIRALFIEVGGVTVLSKLVSFIFVFTGLTLVGLFMQAIQTVVFDDDYQLWEVNAEDLVNGGDFVGYQRGSFVEVVLKQLNFHESQLRVYKSPEEYDDALRKGSENGGVSAVFDEMPYIKLFLNKYPGKYRRVGPIYRMEGFGFAFRRGSSLVGDVSRAILSVVEGGNQAKIETAWLGTERKIPGPPKKTPAENFTIYNTWQIFVIAFISIFVLYVVFRLVHAIRHSENKFFKWLRSIFQGNKNELVPADPLADDILDRQPAA